jgi:hypothetical protein
MPSVRKQSHGTPPPGSTRGFQWHALFKRDICSGRAPAHFQQQSFVDEGNKSSSFLASIEMTKQHLNSQAIFVQHDRTDRPRPAVHGSRGPTECRAKKRPHGPKKVFQYQLLHVVSDWAPRREISLLSRRMSAVQEHLT